ncbi:GNAT family N-acetyltransferase [Methylophaga sp.]|uniref:GNAT family N-acetyltransferase n=1 Tax=Methylophaga sp. TaxID=2024840 RepID=UPI0027287991|nr:GNAT family N-acetyltransferase [Methylophaga sp.]MDO8827472.1 GNAT family N-acetyltransferase [Methylophaga sp.]
MTITYRIAQAVDVPKLVHLMEELGYSTSDVALGEVISAIRQGHGEVFVAESGGSAVGCINAIIDVRLAEGKVGEIASLVVLENYRGRGVGKMLLEYAEHWLSTRVKSVRIRANTKRDDAHGFYAASGYTHIKDQRVFIKNV